MFGVLQFTQGQQKGAGTDGVAHDDLPEGQAVIMWSRTRRKTEAGAIFGAAQAAGNLDGIELG